MNANNSSKPNWFRRGTIALVVLGTIGAAAAALSTTMQSQTQTELLTHRVTKGSLSVTVTEQGTLESSSNIEIKSKVKGGSTVLYVIETGTLVKEGDLLVELDTSTIEDNVTQKKISYETALANKIISESNVAVAEKSITEYLEGTFKEEKATIEKEIFDAEQAVRTAQLKRDSAQRLAAKGMVGNLQLESESFAVESAKKELELKKTRLSSLEKYTKEKMLQELTSTLDAAKARLAADDSALDLEKQRLEREKEQLKNCRIESPGEGMVIFPSAAAWRETPDIEEGATVREQQTLLMIPDLNKMQVKLGIHESKVDRLKLGMYAKVELQGFDLEGEVSEIAEVTKPAGWWTGNLVKYDTIVKLPPHPGLKPGMSAIVDVVLAQYDDVLTVPVAAILETPDGFLCWVKEENGLPEKRVIKVGDTNDEFTVVTDGLKEGDEVVLNPLAFIDEAQLQAIKLNATEESETESGDAQSEDSEAAQRGGKESNRDAGKAGEEKSRGDKSADKKPAKTSVGKMIIASTDKNGDGFLTEDEVPEKDRGGFPDTDQNGDGKLSAEEIDAAIEAAKAAAGQ